MIYLVFDLKCGYEKDFADIKDYKFDLSFLCDRRYYDVLTAIDASRATAVLPTEEDLFLQYSQNPERLVKDNRLGAAIFNCASTDIAKRRFPETLSEDSAPLVFPELFSMKNVRLEISEEEKPESAENLLALASGMYDLSEEAEDAAERALERSFAESDSDVRRKA